MKTCTKCGEAKPLSEFTKRKNSKTGYCSWCKKCNNSAIKNRYHENAEYRQSIKNRKYKNTFGITLEEYKRLYLLQKGCCAICGEHSDTHDRELAVDHCHKSGKVRALLCKNCNLSLGLLKESTNTLLNMISYLKEHSE